MGTRRQERVAEILAEDPKISKTQALVKAGYSATTASRHQKRTLEAGGVQGALSQIETQRSDSARSIKKAAAGEILARIETGQASDALVVASYKTAHEVAQDEPEARGEYDAHKFRTRLRRALVRAWKAGHRSGIIFAQNADSPPKD